jgi:hypothetical protein
LLAEEQPSSLGEKILDAACRATIPNQNEGQATAEIWTEGLIVKPQQGRTIYLPYTEASSISADNFRVKVITGSGPITLQALGAKYDALAQRLTDAWGDSLARALLMNEMIVLYETRGRYSQQTGPVQSIGTCRARIQPASYLHLPSNKPPTRIPYSILTSYANEAYTIKLQTPRTTIVLSQLGANQKFLYDKLTSAIRAVEQDSLNTVRQILPSLGYAQLQAIAHLMSEGKAAKRQEIERVSTEIWKLLEQYINQSPLAETYAHLTGIGLADQTASGLHKTLDNVYVWFMIPILGTKDSGGNTLAMEVTSETGHATYLYRVMPRRDFPTASKESFQSDSDKTIDMVNEAMIDTGFRREPIYLRDQQLLTPNYSKYLYASKNLERLKFLRERYYARIIHHTTDQWKTDLGAALLFNTGTNDDDAVWSKSEPEPADAPSWPVPEPEPMSTGISSPILQATPTIDPPVPGSSSQILSLQSPPTKTMATPVLQNMAERNLTVSRMESYSEGKVRLWLSDTEMEHETAIVLSNEDAGRLAAFPGSKVKISLQKI